MPGRGREVHTESGRETAPLTGEARWRGCAWRRRGEMTMPKARRHSNERRRAAPHCHEESLALLRQARPVRLSSHPCNPHAP
eukprot:4145310-Alexandrium_andersonii.AAC.1